MFLEIDHLVVFDFHAFAFQQLLHEVGAVKMVLAREHAVAVHDTVRGHIFALTRGIHRPADHTRRACAAEHFGNRAVRRDFAIRNLPRDVVDAFKEIVVVGMLSQNNIRGC